MGVLWSSGENKPTKETHHLQEVTLSDLHDYEHHLLWMYNSHKHTSFFREALAKRLKKYNDIVMHDVGNIHGQVYFVWYKDATHFIKFLSSNGVLFEITTYNGLAGTIFKGKPIPITETEETVKLVNYAINKINSHFDAVFKEMKTWSVLDKHLNTVEEENRKKQYRVIEHP